MEKYKRLEIYLGWTCNHKCIFCVEMPTMVKMWNKKISHSDVLKKLLVYKKQGYNHVTYLGGEPFIQKNFDFALKIGKKLGYTIMVTTNANMLQFDHIAEKYLPYIDQLVISIPIIDTELQPIINDTKAIINFDKVFTNISKHWKGNFLKVNTVMNPLNIDHLEGIVDFLHKYGVKELSFTYPDIYHSFYGDKHVLSKIALPYEEVIKRGKQAMGKAIGYGIRTKITDIPFCFLPDESWIQYTDDFDYQGRTKVMYDERVLTRVSTGIDLNEKKKKVNMNELDNEEHSPRMRKYIDECTKCKYYGVCWGPSQYYKDLFDITTIKAL